METARIEAPSVIIQWLASKAWGQRDMTATRNPKIATLIDVSAPPSHAETSSETASPAPLSHVWLVVALVAVNLVVAVTPRFFPYGDTPNHLARYTLISAAWQGNAPAWVHFRWLPTGYIAVDILGAALVTVTSPSTALRILAGAYVVLLPLGTFALIRAVNPRAVGWTLVACLVTFNWYFFAGFLSYSLGMAVALLWLAWWWPRRKRRSLVIRLIGVIGIAALFLIHMAAAATALIPVGVACIEPLLAPSRTHKFVIRRTLRRIVTAAAYFAPAVALNLFMKWNSAFPQYDSEIIFRPALDKFSHVFAPFLSFSKIDGILVVVAYAIALTNCWSSREPRKRVSLWPLAAGAMAICYFVSPVYLFAAWDVDVRFLLPALLIAFVAPTFEAPRPTSSVVVSLLFGAGLLHAAATLWDAQQMDTRIDSFLTVMQTVPKGANTLVLVSDHEEDFRVDPFSHVGEWITVKDGSSRVSGLFSGGPNGAYLAHFLACPQLYDVGVEWARNGFPALDWSLIQRDYGYIALVGANPTARRRIKAGATPIVTTPSAAVYRVAYTAINAGRVWPVDSVAAKMCKP